MIWESTQAPAEHSLANRPLVYLLLCARRLVHVMLSSLRELPKDFEGTLHNLKISRIQDHMNAI